MRISLLSFLCICVFAISGSATGVGSIAYSAHLDGVSLHAIAVDRFGNAYVTGSGGNLALTPGVFVAKVNSAGTLVYSTYVGGSFSVGNGIAVDWNGNAYVTGIASAGLPTTQDSFQPNPGMSGEGPFVLKLDGHGNVVYATYLGGDYIDYGYDIAVDLQGSAYVTGLTTGGFPTTPNSINDNTFCSEFCGFVAKLNATGSSLLYSDYLGTFDVIPRRIGVDTLGQAYVAGVTNGGFITTHNSFEPSWPAGPTDSFEAFVVKLDKAGSSFVYSTYLGGKVCSPIGGCEGSGAAQGIAVDLLGNAYVTGNTEAGFPTTKKSVQPTFGGGGENGFVAALNPKGKSLVYSSYLGGAAAEFGYDVAVDLLGNAYVLLGTADAFQIVKLNAKGTSLITLYTGGPPAVWNVRIAVDYGGGLYVASSDGSVTKIISR